MNHQDSTSLHKMMALLQDYVNHLRMTEFPRTDPRSSNTENYYMPSETVTADEWAEFENVYQVHAPKVFMNNSIRNVRRSWYAPSILLLIQCTDHATILQLFKGPAGI
jgi:hypothetical protein